MLVQGEIDVGLDAPGLCLRGVTHHDHARIGRLGADLQIVEGIHEHRNVEQHAAVQQTALAADLVGDGILVLHEFLAQHEGVAAVVDAATLVARGHRGVDVDVVVDLVLELRRPGEEIVVDAERLLALVAVGRDERAAADAETGRGDLTHIGVGAGVERAVREAGYAEVDERQRRAVGQVDPQAYLVDAVFFFPAVAHAYAEFELLGDGVGSLGEG